MLAEENVREGTILWLRYPINFMSGFTKIKVVGGDIVDKYEILPDGRPYKGKSLALLYEGHSGKELTIEISGSPYWTPGNLSRLFYFEDPAKKFARWGKKVHDAIFYHQVFRGMSSDQVVASWGSPTKVNSSVGSWGRHEQWVYGDSQYLYFENGRLTSWQN